MRHALVGLLMGLLVVPALALVLAVPSALADDCRPDRIGVRGDFGQVSFTIEIADTAKERSKGLMHRDHMARGTGMLFVYDKPQAARFWMKNTLIELDMLFADKTGRITYVHHRAIPGDLTPVGRGEAVFGVLEINGGLAQTYGITPGSVMRHPAFSQGPAAWPC